METMINLVEKSGPLIVIFAIFMMTYLEDRKSNKDDRDRSNSLTENVAKMSEEMVRVVEENTCTNTNMIERLADAVGFHDELDTDVKDIKTTLQNAISKIERLEENSNVTEIVENEVLPMLIKIDEKVDRVGKSVNTERGDSHGHS